MPGVSGAKIIGGIQQAARQLKRPENLAFLPALTLAAFWLGGEQMLILTALGLPLVFLMLGAFHINSAGPRAVRAPSGVIQRAGLIDQIDAILASNARDGRSTACLVIHLDDIRDVIDVHGHAAHAEILQRTSDRLRGALREIDTFARLDGDSFAVALGAVRQADLESILQLAARLQAVVSAPISLNAVSIYISASVGFCLASRAPQATGVAFLEAAEIAADDARQNGPSGIRAFSAELQRLRTDRTELRADLQTALDEGQILPFFQPQVATLSGEITGFEALARWQHPKRGLIPPAEFIPLIEQAGLSERLGEVILNQSLTALASWDAAGLRVPTIAVNFSHEQLRNPRLAEVLKWELDRFDLTPERLTVEILETVVAETDNDVIVHNIAALSRLGCGLDLDDFGTGHASIANIRRFSVRRIKIDRSFITHVDGDTGQQRMVSAILSMATQLGLETLAEGVETVEEHAMLAQLGCGHIQGFGIARPMDFDASTIWIRHYRGKLTSVPRIGRHAV
jgi:diguanylate cyclase